PTLFAVQNLPNFHIRYPHHCFNKIYIHSRQLNSSRHDVKDILTGLFLTTSQATWSITSYPPSSYRTLPITRYQQSCCISFNQFLGGELTQKDIQSSLSPKIQELEKYSSVVLILEQQFSPRVNLDFLWGERTQLKVYLFLVDLRKGDVSIYYVCFLCSNKYILLETGNISKSDLDFKGQWSIHQMALYSTRIRTELQLNQLCSIRPLRIWYFQCGYFNYLVPILQSKLNFSTVYSADLSAVYHHRYGNLLYNVWSDLVTRENSSLLINHKRFGHHLIYCEYGAQSQIRFNDWVAPYRREVWAVIGLTLVASSFLLGNQARNWIHLLAICFRQGYPTFSRKLVPITFLIIPILLVYEYYLASRLVVPPVQEHLSSLRKVIKAGFEIYGQKQPDGINLPSLRSRLSFDFELAGLPDKVDRTVFETRAQNILQILGPTRPNRSILIATENLDYIVQFIERNHLKGMKSRCHKIENFALVMTYFDVVRVRRYREVGRVANFMETMGFTKLWRERYKFYLKVTYIPWAVDTKSFVNRINYDDLVSLCIFCSILVAGAILIYLFEMGTLLKKL
ncbi:hypothetical protein Fcan01_25875, partial [Folsomia candida]